jgi:hypothetical protein
VERVGATKRRVRIAQRRPTREQLAVARWYLEGAPSDVDEREVTRLMSGHAYTFYDAPPHGNETFARELIGMREWQRKSDAREPADDLEVQVVTLGDVALAALPVELFAELGLQLKGRSPVRETFVVTVANGYHGYVPTPRAFDHGGYETRLADGARIHRGGDAVGESGQEKQSGKTVEPRTDLSAHPRLLSVVRVCTRPTC